MSTGRTILIGDVHGCLAELQALLAKVRVCAGDAVILVGDLTAKGPESQGVVQLAREQGFRAVLGNHDAHVLRLHGSEGQAGKSEHEKVAASLQPPDWSYLLALPLSLELHGEKVIVVHGGLVPGIPVAEQRQEDLLNLRSITPDGRPSRRVDEGAPWASRWPGPRHVVFGHDALRGLQRHPFATGLDTGCVYGKELTALILPQRKLVSVPAKRAYVKVKD